MSPAGTRKSSEKPFGNFDAAISCFALAGSCGYGFTASVQYFIFAIVLFAASDLPA